MSIECTLHTVNYETLSWHAFYKAQKFSAENFLCTDPSQLPMFLKYIT